MADLLQEIVKKDEEARALKKEAQDFQAECDKEIQEGTVKIHDEYIEKAKEKVKESLKETKENEEKKYDLQVEKAKEIKEKLEENYKQNKDTWVNNIFESIVK